MATLTWFYAHRDTIAAILACIVLCWKRLKPETRQMIETTYPRVGGFFRLLSAVGFDLLDGALAFRWQIIAGIPKAEVLARASKPPSASPDAPRDTDPPAPPPAGLSTIAGVFLLALSATALAGCPRWERAVCGTPGAHTCVGNWPHYCATGTSTMTAIGDEPCASGSTCAINDAGVSYCAPNGVTP